MLLIDGVKFNEWKYTSEDEFEHEFSEHDEDIFGKDAKYFDLKHKLTSKAGTGSIPDGYVITLGEKPEVKIIELELASHTQQHIVSQLLNIINGIEEPSTQRRICNAIEDQINQNESYAMKVTKAIKPFAIHRFLSDSFSNRPPEIYIIIDKSSPPLDEAVNKIALAHPCEIREFQTFTRESVGLDVHAHLFEPVGTTTVLKEETALTAPVPESRPVVISPSSSQPRKIAMFVTFEMLVKEGLLKDGQVMLFYNTRLFDNERATVVASENKLKYEVDGLRYSVSSLAKYLLTKYGFHHHRHSVQGPKYWKTEDGKLLHHLNQQIRTEQ